MNKNIKLYYMVFLLAAMIIWGSALYYEQYVNEYFQSVSVRMKDIGVTKDQIKKSIVREKEKGNKQIPRVSTWNQYDNQTIWNCGLKTYVSAGVIEVYGDVIQVYPIQLLSGSILSTADDNGCLLDENTAYELFRTSHVIGNYITYQNKKYFIRGILKTKENIVIIPIHNSKTRFKNMELLYHNQEQGEQSANDFISQNGLSGSYTIIEGCFYAKIMQLLDKMPAWIIGFFLLLRIVHLIWKKRSIPLQAILLTILFFVSWFILKWFMEFQLYLPERLIPTKWSNFNFWVQKFITFQKQMEDITYLTPVSKDIILIRCIKYFLYDNFITLVSLLILMTHRKVFLSGYTFMKDYIIAAGSVCLSILVLIHMGKAFHPTRCYLSMVFLFTMSENVLYLLKNKLLHTYVVHERNGS